MAKSKTKPNCSGNADQLQTNGKKDPNKKKYVSPSTLEHQKKRDNLRMTKFIGSKEEEILTKGISIRDNALREQGFEVKHDEDKTEKFEFDPEHVKKVSFGEYPYPNGSPSEPSEAGSVSSAYPVRSILRKMTRKTIAQAITTLGLKVRNEEVRQKVELIFMRSFARNDSRARRAKAALQKALGENYQLIAQREEKLSFLIQPRAVGAVPQACKDHASPRAKAMMQKVQKS